MTLRLILLLWLLNYTTAQDADCDFYETVIVGRTYVIKSPNHPNNYRPGQTCRWIALCPSGYNCRLDCSEIRLPQSQSCSLDRLLVSLTGDPYLNGAQTYCGTGTLSVISTGQQISVGLLTSTSSPGGKFYCTLVAQAASPTPSCRCGERRTNRIVGGQETGVNEYPMMAALVDRRIVQVKCGGTIISNRHVLTAAHCVYGQNMNFFAIVVGEHDVTIGDSPATQAYQITSFLPHPSYSSSNYDYDIAIVTVATEIVFSDRVGPVCLPFKFANSDFAGSIVTVLGWGTQFIGGPTSNVLRKVDLDVLSQSTCRSRGVAVTDRQMCTFTRGKDACQDDSGGPLLYTDPSTGLLFQAGIISYGQSCATTTPGTNTRVTALLGWIRNNAPYNYCSK